MTHPTSVPQTAPGTVWLVGAGPGDPDLLTVKAARIIARARLIVHDGLVDDAILALARPEMPFRRTIMAILLSPMIVPIIITATGLFFFYSATGLSGTYVGLILAHAVLGIPFVIITVTATLVGFDRSLSRAAASLGASPATGFFRVTMPLILPGVVSGALFAFVTSFDEVVVVLFIAGPEQQTIPRQMWNGIREQLSPSILAVATILVAVSVALLAVIELLRRRSERLRGVTPA